jgi:GTPase SAR1 family protein
MPQQEGFALLAFLMIRDEILRIKDRDHVPIVVIGNKADLEDQREVPCAKAGCVSREWGAQYYEASARSKCLLILNPGSNSRRITGEQ